MATDDERARVIAELAEVEAAIAACSTGDNYKRRLELLERGVELGATVGELAQGAGQREGTYRQALYKARQRESA